MLNKYLVPEMAQPDVVLEVVMLCGQMLTDGSAAPQLAASGLANALFRLWQDQADTDAELQIQLLYTFFRFLSYQVRRIPSPTLLSSCIGRGWLMKLNSCVQLQ